MKSEQLFAFSSGDSLSQGLVLITGIFLGFVVAEFGGFEAVLIVGAITVTACLGFRCSLVVTQSEAIATKSWFGITYQTLTGPLIEDLWFGGDWGDADGASGVVIKLAGKEIHLGSRRTMKHLYESLLPFTAMRQQHVAQPVAPAEVPEKPGTPLS